MNLSEIVIPKEKLPKPATVKDLRTIHHLVARTFAMGFSPAVVAHRLGMSYGVVLKMREMPAFHELIKHYEEVLVDEFRDKAEDFATLALENTVIAETLIQDRLNRAVEQGEDLSVRELLAISRDGADRLGYGKHSSQTNVNVDIAARLDRAIERSGKGKVIDHVPQPQLKAIQQRVVESTPRVQPNAEPLKRRI